MIRKKVMAGGIVALAAVLGGGGIFAWTHRTADMETLADNQKYVYAYVTSIEGNELTYMEVDESVVEAYLASSTEDTENAEKGRDGSGVPEGSDGSGAPGGSDAAGAPGDSTEASGDGSGAPGDSTEASGDGSGAPGRMSQGTSGTDANTETSDGQPQGENGGMPGDTALDGTEKNGEEAPGGNGGMSGESVTTLIPVSTVVHTTAGTETTFQRLAAGDLLKLLIETSEDGEEVIVEIWMQ